MTRSSLGLEVKTAVKTALGMKNNCYINVKMLFENVRVRVRPYLPFPTTLLCLSIYQLTSYCQLLVGKTRTKIL